MESRRTLLKYAAKKKIKRCLTGAGANTTLASTEQQQQRQQQQQQSLGLGMTSALDVPGPSTSGNQPPVQLGKRSDFVEEIDEEAKRSKMTNTQVDAECSVEDFEDEEQEAELEEGGMPRAGAKEENTVSNNDTPATASQETDDSDVIIFTPEPVEIEVIAISTDEEDITAQEEAAASSQQSTSTASALSPSPPLHTQPAHAEWLPSTSRQLSPSLLEVVHSTTKDFEQEGEQEAELEDGGTSEAEEDETDSESDINNLEDGKKAIKDAQEQLKRREEVLNERLHRVIAVCQEKR